MSYNKPEWPFFVPAILGALIEGAAMPVCAVALVGSMDAFFKLQVPATREEAIAEACGRVGVEPDLGRSVEIWSPQADHIGQCRC